MTREDVIAQYNLGDEKGNLSDREEEFVDKILNEDVPVSKETVMENIDKMFGELEEKYIQDMSGEEIVFSHEKIFGGMEDNQEYIKMFLEMRVNFMMQFETMEIFVVMSSLKTSILQSKQILYEARNNGFDIDPMSKRIVIDSIRRMEHVYQEFNNVFYGARDELDKYIENGEDE